MHIEGLTTMVPMIYRQLFKFILLRLTKKIPIKVKEDILLLSEVGVKLN